MLSPLPLQRRPIGSGSLKIVYTTSGRSAVGETTSKKKCRQRANSSLQSNKRLVIYSPSQGPHLAKKHLTKRVFPDLDDGDIRWISPAIGGGFGARLALGVEPVAVLLARHTSRPVRVTTTREEDFQGYSSRTDMHQTIRVAASKDGKLLAIDQKIVSDSGAYLYYDESGTTVTSGCGQLVVTE